MMLSLVRNLEPGAVTGTVAVMGDGSFIEALEAVPGLDVVRLPAAGRLRDLARLPVTVTRLRNLIREREIDVVQAAGEKMAIYAGWAGRLAGVPVVASLHDSPALKGDRGTRLVQEVMARSPRRATTTCSRWMADEFHRRYGIDVRVIHDALELDQLPSAGAGRAVVRDATGWPADSVVYGFFGRLQHWKGPDVFLDAAAKLVDRPGAETARFLVVGGALYGRDETYAAALPERPAIRALGQRVHFTGYREDALLLMSGVDVVVHCSRLAEPSGVVIIEAASLERTVIATRSRGPEEAIDDGENGLLVPVDDAAALASAMERVLDPRLRARLGQAARRRAIQRHDARRLVTEYTDLWREAARNERSVP